MTSISLLAIACLSQTDDFKLVTLSDRIAEIHVSDNHQHILAVLQGNAYQTLDSNLKVKFSGITSNVIGITREGAPSAVQSADSYRIVRVTTKFTCIETPSDFVVVGRNVWKLPRKYKDGAFTEDLGRNELTAVYLEGNSLVTERIDLQNKVCFRESHLILDFGIKVPQVPVILGVDSYCIFTWGAIESYDDPVFSYDKRSLVQSSEVPRSSIALHLIRVDKGTVTRLFTVAFGAYQYEQGHLAPPPSFRKSVIYDRSTRKLTFCVLDALIQLSLKS